MLKLTAEDDMNHIILSDQLVRGYVTTKYAHSHYTFLTVYGPRDIDLLFRKSSK